MKTFAAAVLAATASADAMAVPDFIAGFMYGMTGDNHLSEIEACYQGGEQIVTDSQTAIADFKSGNYFKGIQDAGKAWNEVSSAMTTCQGMDDDVAAIEAWAQIFTHPTELSKTVAKHWLMHGSQIKADIAKEESDWSAGSYFDAGKDTAAALTLAVGPIQNGIPNMPLDAPLLFVGGLLEGMVGDNHLTEISTCFADGEATVTDVEAVVKAVEAGHWFKAAEDVKTTVTAFTTALTACESMGDDLKAVEQWATIFTHKTDLISTVTKHMIFHKSEIMGDINTIKTDWSGAEYYQAGKATADLLTVAIGPIEVPSEEVVGLDIMMLPDLAAGFVYGMVGDNHLEEIEACYSGVSPLWTYLDASLKDLEAFHIFAAIKQFEKFVFNFQTDMAPCMHGAMHDDLSAIEQWATIFTTPETLVANATKHFLLHKKRITGDIATIKTDWSADKYFDTGVQAADLITTLVGPIES